MINSKFTEGNGGQHLGFRKSTEGFNIVVDRQELIILCCTHFYLYTFYIHKVFLNKNYSLLTFICLYDQTIP